MLALSQDCHYASCRDEAVQGVLLRVLEVGMKERSRLHVSII